MDSSGPVLIYLVRHGATTSTDANLFAGSSNPALSDAGRMQIGKLAERLSRIEFAAAYCSDKQRTIESASILCALHTGLSPIALTALREIDHGHWEGKEHKFVEANFADEYRRWSEDPMRFAPSGGETGQAVLDRALPVLKTTVADHGRGNVLVVSHTGTNRLLIASLLGIDPARYRDRLAQDLACLNILRFRPDRGVQLVLINDTSHYRAIA